MTRTWLSILVGLLLSAPLGNSAPADEPSAEAARAAASSGCENAAVIYWQAFSLMPKEPQDGEAKAWQDFRKAGDLAFKEISPELRKLIDRGFEGSLHELHRATKLPCCDWQLDFAAGPYLILNHLQEASTLSRAALWRARFRFSEGESGDAVTDEALADSVAVLKLARDCGGSPCLVSILVDFVLEKESIDLLAANLTRLDSTQLDRLSAALAELPRSASLAEAVKNEQDSFPGWLSRRIDEEAAKLKETQTGWSIVQGIDETMFDEVSLPDAEASQKKNAKPKAGWIRRQALLESMSVEVVREALEQLRRDYQALVAIASLPYAERAGAWADFEAGLSESRKIEGPDDLRRIFSVAYLPMVGSVQQREEEMLARRELLDLAIQIQSHGPEALDGAKVLGREDIEYKKTTTGFELTYPCAGSDEKVVLRVGAAQ